MGTITVCIYQTFQIIFYLRKCTKLTSETLKYTVYELDLIYNKSRLLQYLNLLNVMLKFSPLHNNLQV